MRKTDYIYIYDDSFISLLCLIKRLFLHNEIPSNIKTNDYYGNLFDKVIKLDIEEDENIIKNMNKNMGPKIFNTLYYVYLSANENKEMLIYYFLYYSLKYKDKIFYMHKISYIDEALKVSKYVSRENHKFKGFLRFKELNTGVLYGEIAPTNNILPILVRHFTTRLKNEFWVIKDTKRDILAIYDKKEVYLLDGRDTNLTIENYSKDEESIQDMWKSFYKTIGIENRRNERCRRNFMPKKYWKYIIEVNEE